MESDYEHYPGDDGSKETLELSETKRVSRNMNEKRRRDRFNVLIGELAAVMPQSTGAGKFDKTTVLKKAIACLRSCQAVVVSRPTTHWQPAFVSDSELNQLLIEAMDAFLLVLDGSGIITFVSDSILSVLGYRPQDFVNNSIADYLDQTDRSCIIAHLALLEKLKTALPPSSNTPCSSLPVSKPINFEMSMNSGPYFDKQMVYIFSCIGQAFLTNTTTSDAQSSPTLHSEQSIVPKLQLVLVCNLNSSIAGLMLPVPNVTSKQFMSRLTLDWKYTYSDHRTMPIIGYQPNELIDKSIYGFIHTEDLANVSTYHEMLVRKGRVTTCYYRFLTKGEMWMWLRSCCYISYNQWNSKPEYVISTTTAVDFEEVYANQAVVVQSNKLEFQSISRDFNSSKTWTVKNPTQTCDPPPSVSVSHLSKEPMVNIGRLWEAHALSLRGRTEGMEQNSNQSDTCRSHENGECMFSTIQAPEGMSPAQSKLHIQLQGKHKLLEKSIQNQIFELQKIKRQIEINKQLWEFNRQLQQRKAVKLAQTATLSYNSDQSSDM